MSGRGNDQRARAAVLDLSPPGPLDSPVRRALRQTRSVGGEGTGRRVARRSAAVRRGLASLQAQEHSLAVDASRDWAACGLLADAVSELLQDADVRGPLWRRLFDSYCRLMRLKSDRRDELSVVLAKVAVTDDPIAAALTGGQGRSAG